MKKQKKQLITLVLLCALLAACLGTFFALRAYNEKQAEEAAAKTSGGEYTVTDLDADGVDSLTVENGQGTLSFYLDDGIWYSTEDESLSIKQSTVTAMVNKICDLKGVDRIEGVTDYDQYGLKDPGLRVTASGSSGNVTLLIGDTNKAVNRVYVQVEGEDTVYTTGTSVETQYDHTLEDLIEEPEADTEDSAAEPAEESGEEGTL